MKIIIFKFTASRKIYLKNLDIQYNLNIIFIHEIKVKKNNAKKSYLYILFLFIYPNTRSIK